MVSSSSSPFFSSPFVDASSSASLKPSSNCDPCNPRAASAFRGAASALFFSRAPRLGNVLVLFLSFFFLDFDGSGPRFFEGEGGINLDAMLFWKWKNMGEREKGKMVTICRIGKY